MKDTPKEAWLRRATGKLKVGIHQSKVKQQDRTIKSAELKTVPSLADKYLSAQATTFVKAQMIESSKRTKSWFRWSLQELCAL